MINKSTSLPFLLLAVSFTPVTTLLRAQVTENFGQPGTSLTNTQFSSVFLRPNAAFERVSLSGVAGAPNTSPALPISQGGDAELRLYEAVSPVASYSWALTPSTFADGSIDGYVGFGIATNFGGLSGGLILRGNSASNFYLAYLNASLPPSGPPSANLLITKATGGTLSLALASLPVPSFDPSNQNYHITFSATGDLLTASLARVSISGGNVVETNLGTINVNDSSYTSGGAGLYAFARAANSVFFDDLTVTPVPEPATSALLGLGLLAAFGFGHRRKSRFARWG